MSQFTAPVSPAPTSYTDSERARGAATYEVLCEKLRIVGCKVPVAVGCRLRYRYIKRGGMLCADGERLESIFVVSSGNFKAQIRVNGKAAVSRFIMSGDIVGVDAICGGHYCCDVISLTDSIVIEIPYSVFKGLCCECSDIQVAVIKYMSKAVHDGMKHMRILAAYRSHTRVAGFLLWLTGRISEAGLSTSMVTLHMSRSEIGSYLGLTHETVSRAISKLRDMGHLAIFGRNVEIKDIRALEAIAASKGNAPRAARDI